VKVEDECSAGHHVGEEFDLTLFSKERYKTYRTPNVCGFLYNAMFPYLFALQFNALFHGKKIETSFLRVAQTTTR
jgi:uncharacterized repeat protein (TIGR04076 family)